MKMADNEGMNQEALSPKKTIRLKPLQSRIAPMNTAAAPAETVTPESTVQLTGASTPGSSVNAIPGGAQQTIRLRPSVSASGSAPEVSQHKTIRLVAKKPSMASAPANAPASAPASTPASASAPTMKLDNVGSVASAQPTIKLSSSAGVSSDAPANATASQPTIKLNTGGAASQPTIKLGTPGGTSAQPTIKLKTGGGNTSAATPSQPTIKLNTEGGAAPAEGVTPNMNTVKLGGGAPLQIKKIDAGVSNVPHSARTMPKLKKTDDEPSPLFLVSSVAALLLLGACAFVMAAQYLNFFEGKNIDVPGLERKVTK